MLSVKLFLSNINSTYSDGKPQLSEKLTHQCRVFQSFTCLHDTNNRCVNLVLSILENTFLCAIVFFNL